jgi:hypothetical protein
MEDHFLFVAMYQNAGFSEGYGGLFPKKILRTVDCCVGCLFLEVFYGDSDNGNDPT